MMDKSRVVVIVEGGVVQNVLVDKETEVIVVDYDSDGLEEDEITMIHGDEAYVYNGVHHGEVNSEEIDYILSCIEEGEEN